MNKWTIFLAAALLLLIAGGSMSQIGNSPANLRCIDPVMTINHSAAQLKVTPAKVTVRMGCKIRLNIVPPKDIDKVSTKPDGPNPGRDNWMYKSNGVRGNIVLEVPMGIIKGDYKFSVKVDGVGTLDPHAKVIP
ncbi:MAG: hypothetical protein V3T36_02485 [Gammaproteobacteria bacterium]